MAFSVVALGQNMTFEQMGSKSCVGDKTIYILWIIAKMASRAVLAMSLFLI